MFDLKHVFKRIEGDKVQNLEIEKITQHVREEYSLDNFPIDPAKIATRLGIPIKEVEFKPYNNDRVSGGIVKEKDSYIIYVNKKDNMTRKRFTIAHELGHFFLKHLDNRGEFVDLHRETYFTNDKDELDSDEFAACLLMGSENIKSRYKILKNVGFSEDYIISKLSSIFVVSQQAVRNRLKKLQLI